MLIVIVKLIRTYRNLMCLKISWLKVMDQIKKGRGQKRSVNDIVSYIS